MAKFLSSEDSVTKVARSKNNITCYQINTHCSLQHLPGELWRLMKNLERKQKRQESKEGCECMIRCSPHNNRCCNVKLTEELGTMSDGLKQQIECIHVSFTWPSLFACDYTMVQERQEKLVTMYSKQEKALDVLKVRPCKWLSVVYHQSVTGQACGKASQVRQWLRTSSGARTPPLQQGVDGVYGEVPVACNNSLVCWLTCLACLDRYKQRQEQLLKQKLQARKIGKIVGSRPYTSSSQQTYHELGPWTSGNSEKWVNTFLIATGIEKNFHRFAIEVFIQLMQDIRHKNKLKVS